MSTQKSDMRTYIQGDISHQEKQSVKAHMDQLGFGSMDSEANSYEATEARAMISSARDVLGSASQLPMHSHTFMEIFRYTSETRVEYLIGTNRYFLQKGDLICIPPGTMHQVLHYEPEDQPCVRDLIVLSPAFLESIGWSSEPGQYYMIRAKEKHRNLWEELCGMCVEEKEKKQPLWQLAMGGAVRILLAQLVRNSDLSIKAEKAGLFEEILTYIDENLEQKISLSGTAAHFFISERSITREFQKNLGISFHRYVTRRRLLLATNLIYKDVPLEEVCQRVGYSDYPTFYRAFKKEYGMAPREMKQGK